MQHGRLRAMAYEEAQDGRCPRCGRKFAPYSRQRETHTRDARTFDHVVPLARRGVDEGNLLLLHKRCNEEKADRPATGCELLTLMVVNLRLGFAR